MGGSGLNEILEEHLKDMAWISLTIAVSIAIFHTSDILRKEFLNNVAEDLLLAIEKYANLSAEYGGEFSILIPNIPLFHYSIVLKDYECCVLIEGICIFKGEGKYNFNEIILESGKTYLIKTLSSGVVLTER
ncbi:MAG: hypothetical protein QXF52_03215 [Thermoproteota archaeon]